MSVKKKISQSRPIWVTLLLLSALVLLFSVLLKNADVALLNPQGIIASEQRDLLIHSVTILMIIAVPTLTVFYRNAWKYRESNVKATHDPNPKHRKSLVFMIWAIPSIIMVVLASIMWPATHKLAPQRAIASTEKTLAVQVVALRWKWLFIYPEKKIATINFVQIPVGTPVTFDLTADEAPMSSFWIPHLGGQLYAMTGHINRINLMADRPGDYAGSSAEINGAGFAGMKFIARASTVEEFNDWVGEVRQSPQILNEAEYKKLLNPSENNKSAFYSRADSSVYANMLKKYAGSHGEHKGTE